MKRGITIADIDPKCLARISPTLRQPGNIEIDVAGKLVARKVGGAPLPGFGKGVLDEPWPAPAIKTKKPREMTKTEREFEAILKREFPQAKVSWEWYTLRLGAHCTYRPDFCVTHECSCVRADNGHAQQYFSIHFYEVKGAYLFKGARKSATTASLTKPKAAATLYPQHRFFVAQKAKDGTWSREEYLPA